MKKEFDLQKETIFLSDFECGKTQKIKIVFNKKEYFIDLDKNACDCIVTMYDNENSKYQSNFFHHIIVKSDAMLSKDVFENFVEIEKAQNIFQKFWRILK